MRDYSCLKQKIYSKAEYSLSAVQDEHIEHIRNWRNSQLNILRQNSPIGIEQQVEYFSTKIWPQLFLSEPENILLSFFYRNVLIGYGGLVHIAWEHNRAEISFLVDPVVAENYFEYEAAFSAFLFLIKRVGFQDLNLHKLFTETYELRSHHISIIESNGFQKEGVLKDHVLFEGKYVNSIFHSCLNESDF